MNDQVESWQDKIRELAPKISNAEYNLLKAQADIKKLQAKLELIATSQGVKTISAQKTYGN